MKIEKISNDYGSFDINMFDYDKVLTISQVGQDITIYCFKENYEKISNIDFDISKKDIKKNLVLLKLLGFLFFHNFKIIYRICYFDRFLK